MKGFWLPRSKQPPTTDTAEVPRPIYAWFFFIQTGRIVFPDGWLELFLHNLSLGLLALTTTDKEKGLFFSSLHHPFMLQRSLSSFSSLDQATTVHTWPCSPNPLSPMLLSSGLHSSSISFLNHNSDTALLVLTRANGLVQISCRLSFDPHSPVWCLPFPEQHNIASLSSTLSSRAIFWRNAREQRQLHGCFILS